MLNINYVSASNIGIKTCLDLQNITDLTSDYYLIQDIDCSDSTNWNGGKGFLPLGDSSHPFTGELNGRDFTIRDLVINDNSLDNSGIFAKAVNSVFENLTFNNCDVTANDFTSLIVSESENCVFKNIEISNSQLTANSYSGFLSARLLGGRNVIDNITLKNNVIEGADYNSGLAGYVNNARVNSVTLKDITLSAKEYSGAMFGRINNSDISYVSANNIQATCTSTDFSFGNLIAYFNDSTLNYADGTDLQLTSNTNTGADGRVSTWIGTMDGSSSLTYNFLNGINATTQTAFGGIANQVKGNSKFKKCHVKNSNISGNGNIGTFINYISGNNSDIQDCFVDNTVIDTTNDKNSSFINIIKPTDYCVLRDCYVKDADISVLGASVFDIGFFANYAYKANVKHCYISNANIDVVDEGWLHAGFIAVADQSNISECYLNKVAMDVGNGGYSAMFIGYMEESQVSDCFVNNSSLAATYNSAGFTVEADGSTVSSVINSYFNTQLTGADNNLLIRYDNANFLVNNVYVNSETNPGVPNTKATGLTTSQITDLINFDSSFSDNIWANGDTIVTLKNNPIKIDSSESEAKLDFKTVYNQLAADTRVSTIYVKSNYDFSDYVTKFTHSLEDQNFYIEDNVIYTKKLLIDNDYHVYNLPLKISNDKGEFFEETVSIKVIPLLDKTQPPADDMENEEKDEELEDESCLSGIKSLIGYENLSNDLQFQDLARYYLENFESKGVEDLLECQEVNTDVANIQRALKKINNLRSNKNKITIRDYRKFVRSFKKEHKKFNKNLLECEDLNYDFDRSCTVDKADFQKYVTVFKQYFEVLKDKQSDWISENLSRRNKRFKLKIGF
jgi:hypothetical protein